MSEVTKVRIKVNRIKLENFLVKFGLVLFRGLVSVVLVSNVPTTNEKFSIFLILAIIDMLSYVGWFIWLLLSDWDDKGFKFLDSFILSNPTVLVILYITHIITKNLYKKSVFKVIDEYSEYRKKLLPLIRRYTLTDAKLILWVKNTMSAKEKTVWYASRNPYSEYMRIFNDSINNDYFIVSGGSTLLSVLHDIKKLHLTTENDYESNVAKSILATQPLLDSIIKSIKEFETNEELQLKQMTEPVIARRAEIIDMLVKDSIEAQQTLMAYARK